jgi:hypothetical protein
MFSKRRIAILVSVVLVVVIGILAITRYVQADSGKKPEKLIGAWYIDVYPDGMESAHALAIFNADGVVQELQPLDRESAGYGTWVMDKNGQVHFTVVELLWDATNAYIGKVIISQTLNRDAANDTWGGPFTFTMYDKDGENPGVFPGTAKFTRIALEPAP